jgi:ankyrin repeat protein
MPFTVSIKKAENELKQELRSILEEEGTEKLEAFLIKHREELKVKDLLNQPADKKDLELPLQFACIEDDDNVEKVKLLLEFGADLHKFDRGGRSIIHTACTRNCINIVKFCLESGIEIDLKNPNSGTTPLTIAVMNGFYDLTKYLLEQGADFLYEHNKQRIKDIADNQSSDEVTELINTYVKRDENWKNRRSLLKMYVKKTPIARLNIFLFRKVILYA